MNIALAYLLIVVLLAVFVVLLIAVIRALRRGKGDQPAQQNYGQPYPMPPPEPAPGTPPDTSRLQRVYSSGGFLTTKMEIFADAATGAEYLVVTGGSGVAVTPMVPRESVPTEERIV